MEVAGDVSTLIAAVSNLGATSALVVYLMWKNSKDAERRDKMQADHQAKVLLFEERRLMLDREQTENDKALAASLSALTAAIQNRSHE